VNLRDQLIAAWPDLEDDHETLLDSLAGLDDFEEQIIATMRHVAEREAHAKAMGDLIEGMQARKQRLESGAKWLRAAVLHAMTEAKVPRIKRPDMSLSVGAGKPRLVIIDDAAVPEALCRIERTPNKKEIAQWLSEVDGMPNWAKWEEAKPFLSVHKR
jgi:monoamine oxidase